MLLLAATAPFARTQAPAAIRPDDPASVASGIAAAFKAGQRSVVIPPGTYRIPGPTGSRHLIFNDLKDFEIDGTGVTLLLADQTKGAVLFNHCRNVTVRGITFRNAVPPFTQGVIETIGSDRKTCEVRIDAGYPDTYDDPKKFSVKGSVYVFDRQTRRLKDGTGDYQRTMVERLEPDRFRVTFAGALGKEVEAGDLFASRGSGGMGVHSDQCAAMVFDGVTMEYSGVFGFFETGGDGGNRYTGIKVQPGPRPAGATSDPLLSENADGFHSSMTRHGPTIENSFFTRMPDDGIAIHGSYQLVREAAGTRLVISQPGPAAVYAPDDRIGLLSAEGTPQGEAKVVTIQALPEGYKAPLPTDLRHFRNSGRFFEITLDRAVPDLADGSFTSTLDRLGNGYVLRGNKILDHRARGMLLKARDGLVENNVIDGSSIAGIVLAPELWWGEADYSQNVAVRGNTITHVGYATTSPNNPQAGALTLLGERDAPTARGHRNILIENNTLAEIDGVQMVLDGVEGCTVRNNRFLDAQRRPNLRGSAKGIDAGALVYINRAQDVLLVGNTAERLGAANTRTVAVTTNASKITGAADGLRTVTSPSH